MDFNYRPPQTIPEGKPCFSPTLKCDILNINNLFFEENLNRNSDQFVAAGVREGKLGGINGECLGDKRGGGGSPLADP